METIRKGIIKFQKEVYPERRELFESLANNQDPQHLLITCADSRVCPELITQTDPGQLFLCRNAGNMVPNYHGEGGVSATIEYAVSVLNVRDIIILGHTDCGAMKGILHPEKLEGMPTVQNWLRHGESARQVVLENYPNLPEHLLLDVLTRENIIAQLDNLKTHPSVAARLRSRRLTIHGFIYVIQTGHVEAYDAARGFIPLEQYESGRAVLPQQTAAPHLDKFPVGLGA